MKLSARNKLQGKIVSLTEGQVNCAVGIQLPGGEVISATITLQSAKDMGLKVGDEAYAVIKASSVMVAVDD